MKKLVLALTAVAAFTGSAVAADLGPRTYSKAPAYIEPVYNWTGFYIFGGAGGGLWAADSNVISTGGILGPAGTNIFRDQRLGGSGWFGTVGAGYDWQFGGNWVVGIFGDGQFGDISGSLSDLALTSEGRVKLESSYAGGVRLGYLIAPNVYSYANVGYTGSHWSGASLSTLAAVGGPVTSTTPSFNRNGWFIGGGVEHNLNIFGVNAPGWFMKTEYRSSYYDRISLPGTFVATGLPTTTAVTFKPWTQTISTSLVYRFNWGGPVVAKY